MEIPLGMINVVYLQALIAACLRDAASQPEAVGYVAVHGTGTPLGDPIEVGALAGSLVGKGASPTHRPALGSVKVWANCKT